MKYTIYSTKKDYEIMYKKLKELSEKYDMPLDWKKIKQASLDSLSPLPSIMERTYKRRNQ